MFSYFLCFSTWWASHWRCSDYGPSWGWWLRYDLLTPAPPIHNLSLTHTRFSPVTFHLLRFLWLGLWLASSTVTMATPLCGSRSSLASPLPFWCTSTTTTSSTTKGPHSCPQASSSFHTRTRAGRLNRTEGAVKRRGIGCSRQTSWIRWKLFQKARVAKIWSGFAETFDERRRSPGLPKGAEVLLKWKHCWVTRRSWTSGKCRNVPERAAVGW